MSDPCNLSDAPVVNHDEALQLATLNQVGSNLARCYLELRERCEWRPIDTAPKDGTTVIIAVDGCVGAGYYRKRNKGYPGSCWHFIHDENECNPSVWISYPERLCSPRSQLPGHGKA